MKTLIGGRIIVQCDWNECLRERDASFWIMHKESEGKSTYANVRVSECAVNELLGKLACDSEEFSVEHIARDQIMIKHNKGDQQGVSARFLRPERVFVDLHKPKKRIACIDVTSSGLGVSTDDDGNLLVWQSSDGQLRRRLMGSVGDVYVAKFYPSGVVVLSGGADLRLRVWSAETGQCAATLVGHEGAVRDCTFVDRGRNVLSASKDGSLRLWDCGTQRELARINCEHGPLNACAIQQSDAIPQLQKDDVTHSELECGTQQKLVAVACESNACLVYDLHSRQRVCTLRSDIRDSSESTADCAKSAVSCCTFLSDKLVAYGCESSRIVVADLTKSDQAEFVYMVPSRSSVNTIVSLNARIGPELLQQIAFIAAFNDGSCVLFRSRENDAKSFFEVLELTGPDCDALYSVACAQERSDVLVFTACRDGAIRKYRFDMSSL